MFHPIYLHPTLNLAALAEVRAAEAAAKAEEAEYLAYQAALQEERALYSQRLPPFWYQPSPAYCVGQCSTHSCGCTHEAQAPVSSAYLNSQPLFGQPTAPSYGRPLFAHQYGSRDTYHPHDHQQIPAALLHSALVEKELKAKLREETIARHRAEQELRRKEAELAARQRQLAAMADSKRNHTRGNGSPQCWPFLGLPQAPSHHHPLQHKPQPLPSKPAPKRTDDADFIQRMLLASLYGASAPANTTQTMESPLPKKVNEAPKPNLSTRNQKSSLEGSLIEQLKARYTNEGHDEVRDTIRAVINSLSDNKPSKKQDVNAAAGTSRSAVDSRSNDPYADFIRATINTLSSKPPAGPTSQTRTAASSSTKGKAKDTTSPSDSVDLKAALERVESIEHTFHHLKAEFELPSQLDFIAAPLRLGGDTSSVFPHLAFTARNHPVRYYEQTLTTLLNQLDLIESHGDATLRRRRKDAVSSIEKALDELEREVAYLWKARATAEEQESKKHEQSPSSATAPFSSEYPETSTIKHPQPVRIPIIDLDAKVGSTTQDTDVEEDSVDPVFAANGSVLTQVAVNSGPTPAAEEKDAEEQEQTEPVASSPNPTLAEPAPETASPSDEDDLARASPVAEDHVVQLTTEEEEQEVVQEHGALDASEEPSKEDSDAAIVEETPSIDDSLPLPKPSVVTDSQEEDTDDDTLAEDTFLLATPESPKAKSKRASVEEDLGSDWSDLDA